MVCAAPMSEAIAMIRSDESLSAETALLREQFRIENENFGSVKRGANTWQDKILKEMADADADTVKKEKQCFRELAETLPDNIKHGLPSITPSGWVFVHTEQGQRNGKSFFNPCSRKITGDKMIPNGIVCVDFDHLYD